MFSRAHTIHVGLVTVITRIDALRLYAGPGLYVMFYGITLFADCELRAADASSSGFRLTRVQNLSDIGFYNCFYNCNTVSMFALLVANWLLCINKFDLIPVQRVITPCMLGGCRREQRSTCVVRVITGYAYFVGSSWAL